MIINKMPTGINNKILPGFTYTGNYQVVDDGDAGWRIKFLSSGTLNVDRRAKIDVFCVGGGCSGDYMKLESGSPSGWVGWSEGGNGGGGGCTETLKNVNIIANTNYQVVVGAGGEAVQAVDYVGPGFLYSPGAPSYAFGCTANGADLTFYGNYGGARGHGGSGSSDPQSLATNGGSDGAYVGGTTREFGEPNGDLYAGGGGGAAGGWQSQNTYGLGGAGGGGNGASNSSNAGNGAANTGGGGGGGFVRYNSGNKWTGRPSGAGGSGIVIIRNHRA